MQTASLFVGKFASTVQSIGETRSLVDEAIRQRNAVLLFFKDWDQDKFVKYDRYLKPLFRPLYNKLHRNRKKTGHQVSFDLMTLALKQQGYVVRVNDYASARKHPSYPVGLIGHPRLVEEWTLPNPAILGPAMYDHPKLAPQLMENPNFKAYLLASPWIYEMYRRYYGDKCAQWFAGIDTGDWRDASSSPKDIDFLVYDKIRWNHDELEGSLLTPIQNLLHHRGFRTETIRYLRHDHDTYRKLLRRARAMVFICEHETQGLAYQEAMASNVPILAWDNGFWLDPLWKRFNETMIPASSVPYFSPSCGERFADWPDFAPALERFLDRMPSFNPRKYVCENLSLKRSAEIYANLYFSALR
jgi:hypothetical protein